MPFQKGHKLAKGGKRPGSGRKPLAIRELCAKAFKDRIPILNEIADDVKTSPRDRIAAIQALAKVGVPAQHEVENTGQIGFHPITLEGDKEPTADGPDD